MDKEKKNENKEKEEIKEQPEKKNDVKNEREANKEKELNEQISKLKDELEDVKDRHTRLIAEFDNLKKEAQKKEKDYTIQ